MRMMDPSSMAKEKLSVQNLVPNIAVDESSQADPQAKLEK